MKTHLEIAEKYLPVFWMDEKEPFAIDALGYTVFTEDAPSGSFPKRFLTADWDRTKWLVEYAIWFDYDIQHLYELEHVWVYVGKDGKVWKVEGSFHGKFLNQVKLDTGEVSVDGDGIPEVYLQPGKHAIVPDKRVIALIPQWQESCQELAGTDGLLVQDMFRDSLLAEDTEQTQEQVRRYIKDTYAFEPSMEFRPFRPDPSLLMAWQELKDSIPARLKKELSVIRDSVK